MYFTESHVQIVSRGVLENGERLVARGVAVHAPWWTFGIKLFHKTFLLLSTDQRLVMIEHKNDFFLRGLKTDKVHSLPWSSVSELKVKGLFLKKKLRVVGQGNFGPVKATYKVPGFLGPISDNVQNLRQMEQAAAAQRTLGAGASPMALPPAYGAPAPQAAYGAPPSLPPASMPPAYGAPPASGYGAPPSMPPVNAMGYASVPPPAPAPVSQVPSPFGPSPAYQAWPTTGNPGGYPPAS